MLATHPLISLLLHVSSFPLFFPSLCSYRVFWRFNMRTDDGWIISNSSFHIALAFSLRTYQWQCFPFLATVRDTVHPPPLWPWLNDTINLTLGPLAWHQIYHNLLPKGHIQLSLMPSIKIFLNFCWSLTDTLNEITITALSVSLSLHVRWDISYQLLKNSYELHTRDI